MSGAIQSVVAVRMPQVNVNDEEVTLVGWHVADGGHVAEGQPLCEIETSKAVGDVPSPASGVLRRLASVGDVVRIGEVFACIGPSMEAVEEFAAGQVAQHAGSSESPVEGGSGEAGVDATAGAVELARRYGIDLASVPARGRVRRADVEQYIADHELTDPVADQGVLSEAKHLPPALSDKVIDAGPLPGHLRSIAEHLARTQSRVVVAHVVMDVDMRGAMAWIESRRKAGVMTGSVPIVLHAAAAAIAVEPRLRQFRLGGRVYAYRTVDIAFAARSGEGRLLTPVVRGVDRLGLDELASECARLSMAAFRGRLGPAEMSGGCMTVSVLSDQPVRLHIGLQNLCQSVLITAGAIREEVRLRDGRPTEVPTMTLTMSYDHGLMDGWEASAALNAARACIEQVRP